MDEYQWKVYDTAYHAIYGRILIVELDPLYSIAEVMLGAGYRERYPDISPIQIVFRGDLYKRPDCGEEFDLIWMSIKGYKL